MSHACHCFWKCYKTLTFCSLLTRCIIPCACHAKRHFKVQKWREHVVLLTFCHFGFEMRFAPQQHALFRHHNFQKWSEHAHFRHLNFQKWSEHGVFCTFVPQRRALFRHLNFQKWSGAAVLCTNWLGNVLRATTACNFSSLIWPAGSAPAALASLLFDPLEPQIIGKTVFRDFLTFSRTCIFFLLTLSLLWSSLFCSSLPYSSAPPLLFICPYCRRFD